jgi:hypothetical protein
MAVARLDNPLIIFPGHPGESAPNALQRANTGDDRNFSLELSGSRSILNLPLDLFKAGYSTLVVFVGALLLCTKLVIGGHGGG